MNRLNLDFSIESIEGRNDFLRAYISALPFTLTEDECETCANYVLWGKKDNGRNAVQDKELQIDTKYSTWTSGPLEESLDALLEQPTFSENSLLPLSAPPTKLVHQKFSRSEALAQCPPDLVPTYTNLFNQIDTIDLQLNYYDLLHGKRKEEPRASLLSRFTNDERLNLQAKGEALTQRAYLRLRHTLVELRRQQYTLRDSYTSVVQKTTPTPLSVPETLVFDADIPVYPLGLISSSELASLIFQEHVSPLAYTQPQILALNEYYWQKTTEPRPRIHFDFCNPDHVHALFEQYLDVDDAAQDVSIESTTPALIATLGYYRRHASLTQAHSDILEMKMAKLPNSEIAKAINYKFDKTYSANYISTIFCQKIIPLICDAARIHAEQIVNLVFPENFKKCTLCGRHLLINDDFFVKKTRSKDGYANRCKRCDKSERERKKSYVPKFTALNI